MLKRAFDITLSAIMILLLSPAFIIICSVIFIKIGRPIFFKQARPGLSGRPFEMIKFRSMNNDVDEFGNLLPDRQRITSFGSVIRATSLDELPELWNIFRGDMSFVGPRPLLMRYLTRYNTRQARRHEVKPGLTGYAQINGRNAISWADKFELDVWYVENRTFVLDMKIFAITVWKVLRREGINATEDDTMPEFFG